MAIVTVDAPGMENSLMIEQLMPRPPDVVHDLVAPLFLDRLAHARADIVEHLIPADALPLPLPSFTGSSQRITNPFRIGDLVERRRSLGAVSAAASGMFRIAFETPDQVSFFFNETEQTAGRLAVETNRRNDPAMLLDFARPLRGVVLDPIVPFFYRWIARQTALFRQPQSRGVQWCLRITHSCNSQLRGTAWPALIHRCSYIHRPRRTSTAAAICAIADPKGQSIKAAGIKAPTPTATIQNNRLSEPLISRSPARTASSTPCFINKSLKTMAKLTKSAMRRMFTSQTNNCALMN